jgi:hypothetical protein
MSRGTYVAYNAYFDSGGPWGLLGSFYAAYIEAKIQRPFRSLVDVLSGSSMGGLNAESLAADAPAARLMYSTYACSMDMIDRPAIWSATRSLIEAWAGTFWSIITITPSCAGCWRCISANVPWVNCRFHFW